MTCFFEKAKNCWQQLAADESGATAVEYAVVAAGIFVLLFVGMTNYRGGLSALFSGVATKFLAAVT